MTQLYITGSCPKCGAPIYAPKHLQTGQLVAATYSCSCFTTQADAKESASVKPGQQILNEGGDR